MEEDRHEPRETGEVLVRRLTGAYDVGTVINPHGLDGQIEGGLVQGLGAALMEEVRRSGVAVEIAAATAFSLSSSGASTA